ncbi:50S ribosomal protein L24 [Sulfuracidifex tepidarius]|uniref:Large ribosomal subunit protein uL24 n=1 Tax=Sulfuracidifex tepidarius TaxID=1294262 RepID=A0A510DVY7_9CREN|nr:50S ribosomal protein L24 [Sulfuracidifex tepidarius]BBG24391.1 50S ribosomal protein L24 [Sulfuracidifex tepidarius]BBG27149.1 50S ribosomal protein L24 [Sulfuracidifex tepidarius]
MVSSKPSKQRNLLRHAPKHLRKNFLVAPVADDIKSQQGISRINVKKGDTVKVVRGEHIGTEGKVAVIDTKTGRIGIEGLSRKKVDGTPVYVMVHSSKVVITKLDLGDNKRRESIERKAAERKKTLERTQSTSTS